MPLYPPAGGGTGGTPDPHNTSHQNGGSDEISVAGLSGVLADPQPPIIGAGAAQAVAGNDTRLTDSRTPTAHGNAAHTSTFITATGVTYENLDANGDVGTGAGQLSIGNHAHANDHVRQHSITSGSDHTFPGGTTNFLREDGSFTTPTASVAAPFTGNQATGSFTIATEQFGIQGKRLTLTSTDRATLQGTGRLIICG